MKNHVQIQVTWPKRQFFANSRWRTAAILKIVLAPYLSRESSDFDQIWSANVNFHSENGQLMNNRNFALKMAIECHTENRWSATRANLADLREICIGDAESLADMVYVTKTAIFDNSTWRQPPCWKVFRSLEIRHSCNELKLPNVFQ